MLESMFVRGDRRIGNLSKPLSGLVLHLGEGGQDSSPSEAAWLGVENDVALEKGSASESGDLADSTYGSEESSGSSTSPVMPKVKVLVSPSSLTTMRKVYSRFGHNVTVEPLYFLQSELDAEAFLSMMAIDTSEQAPLYIQIVLVSNFVVAFSRQGKLT